MGDDPLQEKFADSLSPSVPFTGVSVGCRWGWAVVMRGGGLPLPAAWSAQGHSRVKHLAPHPCPVTHPLTSAARDTQHLPIGYEPGFLLDVEGTEIDKT